MSATTSFLKQCKKLTLPIFLLLISVSTIRSSEPVVKIHYLGHSSFILQFDNGISIVTDYGHYNAWAEWGWDSPVNGIGDLLPDVMTFSHQHDDHYDADRIPEGVSHILTGSDSLTINGIKMVPVRTCEDNINTESNTSYMFLYKGIRICHLGDAQAQIMNIKNQEVSNHISNIFTDTLDLLLMPIEGKQKFIPEAEAFIDLLKPARIIPMHFWSQKYKDDFLDYLRSENNSGKRYQIDVSDNAGYELRESGNSDSIEVICLEAAPY